MENDTPQRVMWSLDILEESLVPDFALRNPSEHMFQLSFPSHEAAEHFVAEIQRYVGNTAMRFLDKGIEVHVKP